MSQTLGGASLRPLPDPLRRAAVPVLGAVLGVGALFQPLLVGLLSVAAIVGLAILRRPETATYLALFVLYSNAATVAVRYHGVPRALGMAFPAILLVPLVERWLVRREPLRLTRGFPWICLFFLASLVSAAFSRHPASALEEAMGFGIEGVGLYFLVTNVVTSKDSLRRATWALLVAGSLMGAVPAFQQLTGTYEKSYGGFGQVTGIGFRTGEVEGGEEVVQRRLSGSIGEKNRFSQVMLMLVPLGIFRVLEERERRAKLLAAGATGLCLVGFVLPFSRGGAVGLVAVVGMMVVLGVLRGRRLLWTTVAAVLVLAATPQYWKRMTSLTKVTGLFSDVKTEQNEPDGALKGRTTEVLGALLVYADHPVLGVGPGQFPRYAQEYGNHLGFRRLDTGRQAHSLFPGIAAETGSLGLFALFGLFAVTLAELFATRRYFAARDPERASMATAWLLVLVAYLVTGLFLHLAYARYAFLVLALAGAAAHRERVPAPALARKPSPAPRPADASSEALP